MSLMPKRTMSVDAPQAGEETRGSENRRDNRRDGRFAAVLQARNDDRTLETVAADDTAEQPDATVSTLATGNQQQGGQALGNNGLVSLQRVAKAVAAKMETIETRFAEWARVVAQAVARGARGVLLRLDPPGLGNVRVRIQVDKKRVRLCVETEVNGTAVALHRDMDRLRAELQEFGLDLVEYDIADTQSAVRDTPQHSKSESETESKEQPTGEDARDGIDVVV